MAFRGSRENEPIEMNLSSMVDIVFLLLIYFIAVATIKQEESELKVAIPIDQQVIEEQKTDTPEEVVLDVFPGGQVFFNGQPIDEPDSADMPNLKYKLQMLKEAYDDQAVVIRGERETEHHRIVAVLNACAYAGIEKLSFPSDSTVFIE